MKIASWSVSMMAIMSSSSVLLAAEEEAKAGGLPQLNLATFPSQIFWTLIIFTILYLLVNFVIAPKIGGMIEMRAQKINQDYQKAEELATNAKSTQAKADADAAKAHSDAKATIAKMMAKVAEETAQIHQNSDAQAAKIWQEKAIKLADYQQRLDKDKNDIIVALSVALVEKIGNIKISPHQVQERMQ